jgi:hypothetical protein
LEGDSCSPSLPVVALPPLPLLDDERHFLVRRAADAEQGTRLLLGTGLDLGRQRLVDLSRRRVAGSGASDGRHGLVGVADIPGLGGVVLQPLALLDSVVDAGFLPDGTPIVGVPLCLEFQVVVAVLLDLAELG